MERKTIREAGASFVKQEQSREAREAQQEFSKVWFSPKVLEVRYPAHDENNVNRARAQNLIGNVDFARTGVMSFGRRNGCRWRYAWRDAPAKPESTDGLGCVGRWAARRSRCWLTERLVALRECDGRCLGVPTRGDRGGGPGRGDAGARHGGIRGWCQVGRGSARSRARAAAKVTAHGQRAGRWSVS